MFKPLSKFLGIEHLFFLYISLGAIKISGYPIITFFLIILGYEIFKGRFTFLCCANKRSWICFFWAVTLLLATMRGAYYDYRVWFIFGQVVLIFFAAARFSELNPVKLDQRAISKWAFSGTLLSFLAYFICAYLNKGDDQENFMGSSALASYAISVFGIWYFLWLHQSKESILFLVISFGLFSFLFGHLDSRYWFILVFCIPLIVFFSPSQFIAFKKRFITALCVFLIGFSMFFVGNYTVSSIANSQKFDIDTVVYKIVNPFRQAKNYLVEHKFIGLNRGGLVNKNLDISVDPPVNAKDVDTCFIASEVIAISSGRTARSHDTERFVEPLIGFLMWYRSGLENFLLGSGLYSSKTEMLGCMSIYYRVAQVEVEHNIGVYRGNTASTFFYEFGLLGILCLAFTLLSLLRFFVRYPVVATVFLILIFQVFLTSVYYAFSFLFPFFLLILKGGSYATQSEKK